MADGTATVTVGAGAWVYIDSMDIPHTVTTNQTFNFYSTDLGTNEAYYKPVVGTSVTTTDGYRVTLRSISNDQFRLHPASNTAVTNDNNSLGDWVFECSSDGKPEVWKCTGLDMDDADNPAEITAARFEKVSDPTQVFTWATLSISFA